MQKLMTVDELADAARVHRGTIYRLSRAGRIPSVRFGGALRFIPDQIETFIRAKANQGGTRERSDI